MSGQPDGNQLVHNITLASELPGTLDLIAECKRLSIRTSLGHSVANG